MRFPIARFLSLSSVLLSLGLGFQCLAQSPAGAPIPPAAAAEAPDKADAEISRNAAEWVSALALTDAAKAQRLRAIISIHLKAVRDWHNQHPYSAVPAGINPATGQPLSPQDRQLIADSAMPRSVHETLMAGLRQDLTPEQVEVILDKYTIGKVAFTLAGYKSIVPDLTPQEEEVIVGFLKQAREQAVDFKGMKLVSAIFEIYKTKCEQSLNSNGRNWKQLYKTYTDAVKAKKAAGKAAGQKPAPTPALAPTPAPSK